MKERSYWCYVSPDQHRPYQDNFDQVLKHPSINAQASLDLSQQFRSQLGPGEYLLLLSCPTGLQAAREARKAFQHAARGQGPSNTYSAGYIEEQSTMPMHTAVELMGYALSSAKRRGGNRELPATPEVIEEQSEYISLNQTLWGDNTVAVVYQPQFTVNSNGCPQTLKGLEALARFSQLKTDSGIEAAEQNGHIFDIGDQVRKQVFTQLIQWTRQGVFQTHPNLRVYFNMGGEELGHPDIVSQVVQELSEYQPGIAQKLGIELTETKQPYHWPTAKDNLAKFSELGFTIRLDDFVLFEHIDHVQLLDGHYSGIKIPRVHVGDDTEVNTCIEFARENSLEVVSEGARKSRIKDFAEKHPHMIHQAFALREPEPAENLNDLLLPPIR